MGFNNTYRIGATVLILAPGATAISVTAPAFVNGLLMQVQAGGSSGVAILNSVGLTASNGYLLGTQVVSVNGPAQFFLVAQGSTASVGIAHSYSVGYSSLP